MKIQDLQEKYADLVLQKGVHIQKNQTLVINGPIEGADFVRLVAKRAYELGAKNVHINWADDYLTHLKYKHAADEVIESFPAWKVAQQEGFAEEGAAFLSIHATDPDLLTDIDPKRVAAANKAAGIALKNFRTYTMNDIVTWSVISIPTTKWAEKIFPDKAGDVAVAALWQTIFKMARVDNDDPIKTWDKHNALLKNAFEFLNEKQYEALHLKAPRTDIKVGLAKNHLWHGGAAVSESGIVFNPNMPTEEVYTAPHKYNVEGHVSSTKPLNYGGSLIEDFTLTFEAGKVIDVKAKKGEAILKDLIEADEGASRIGEMALVPDASPISQSGLIFYNTLFDENASCHIALGKAYPTTVQDGPEMSDEELDAHGVNDSMIHVDFMVGSAQMDIDGVKADGTVEPLFRQGAWVVEF